MSKPEAPVVVVPTLRQAIEDVVYFPEAIQTLIDAGIKKATICRSFGVRYNTLWRWRKGQFLPVDPTIYLAITRWAESVKKQNGSQPQP